MVYRTRNRKQLGRNWLRKDISFEALLSLWLILTAIQSVNGCSDASFIIVVVVVLVVKNLDCTLSQRCAVECCWNYDNGASHHSVSMELFCLVTERYMNYFPRIVTWGDVAGSWNHDVLSDYTAWYRHVLTICLESWYESEMVMSQNHNLSIAGPTS